MAVRGTSTGYDPVHGYYLMAGGLGQVLAVCSNTSGQPVSAPIGVMTNPAVYGTFPRVAFSAQAPDGAGGTGAFLVEWVSTDAPGAIAIHARLVSCAPNVQNVVTADVLVSDYGQLGAYYDVAGSAIAYSATSQRFVIVYRTLQAGIQARFVNAAGSPIGGVMAIANPGGAQFPSVAWNPGMDEFGISYAGYSGVSVCPGAFVGFVRLRASDGALFGRTTFGCSAGTYVTDIAVNRYNNSYILGWSPGSGSMFQQIDANGALTGAGGLLSSTFGGNDNFSIEFNVVSGTFLAVGQHNSSFEIAGVEANSSGFPIGVAQQVTAGTASPGSFYPRVTARTDAAHWGVSYARQFNTMVDQIVATFTTGGGAQVSAPTPTPTPTTSCPGANPFASMGAGVCVNGGWQFGTPASSPAPTQPSTPAPAPTTSAGCPTPNPFASFGMGACVNGGWQFTAPASTPAPTPTPTPTPAPTPTTSAGCATPNPFASMGMGVCVNGGWQFLTPTTPTGPTLCSGTPDPFTTSGGGTCINGGWVPNNSLPTLCSGLPDPFTAMGGGVCINGGWHPRSEEDEEQ